MTVQRLGDLEVSGPKVMPERKFITQIMMGEIREDDRRQMASRNDMDPLDVRTGPDWEMYYAGPDFAPLFHEMARSWDQKDWFTTLEDVIRQLDRTRGALLMGFDIRNRPWVNLDYNAWMQKSPNFQFKPEDQVIIDLEHDSLASQVNLVALGWIIGPDGKLRVAATMWLNNGVIRTGVANSNTVKVATLLAWIMVNPEPNLVTVVERKAGDGLPPKVKKSMGHSAAATVKVVNLRKQVYKNIGDVRAARHLLQHRFIVRGHWRKQPFGPGRNQRKMIYISPFLKGPADAPFMERETVYRW